MNIRSQQANRNPSTADSASLRRPSLFLAFAASHGASLSLHGRP